MEIRRKEQSGKREVEGPMFAPELSDVHDLIAAISKIEKKELSHVAISDHRTQKDDEHQPDFSPTRENWRLSKVLDSIANLCVSETKHEVIATALRVHDKAKMIELIIASNDTVKPSTEAHLRRMWTLLKKISDQCHSGREVNPLQKTEKFRLHNFPSCIQFRQLCLEFSFSKLQKRINEKFSRFSAISTRNMSESHPFQTVQIRVNTIEEAFTRENNPTIGKPDHNDVKGWKDLWTCLVAAKNANDKFLGAGGFTNDMERVKNFPEYESYLRKIESFVNDIHVLLQAANSPQCRHLFTYEFNVKALAKEASEAHSVPETAEQWETVLEKALLFRNINKNDGQGNFLIDIKKVKKDTAYMASGEITRNLIVHCEVKILTDIFENETEITGTPKAYTYVGVSKLSCLGCQALFRAFNAKHGTKFTTKGSHSKSYWPWQFPPQTFATNHEILSLAYRFIANHWVESYTGYTVKRSHLGQDSDAQSTSHDVVGCGDEDAGADAIFQALRVTASRRVFHGTSQK